MSNRGRRDMSPPHRSGGGGGGGSSGNNGSNNNLGSGKLRMDRQPVIARITGYARTDPSLIAGKRKEIDNVMKKARASTNDYWDKKLLEVEEKDPNRWRHTGFKRMYIEGGSTGGGNGGNIIDHSGSSDSERDNYHNTRYARTRSSRSRSRTRKSPTALRGGAGLSPMGGGSMRRRSPRSPPQSEMLRRRSPRSPLGGEPIMRRRLSPRSPSDLRSARPRSPPISSSDIRRRPRSPPEPPMTHGGRRKSPRSPRSPDAMMRHHRRSPPSPMVTSSSSMRRRSPLPPAVAPSKQKGGSILPRSKRPPSPPPRMQKSFNKQGARTPSNSSVSSCSDDSCSMCSPKQRRPRSRSTSLSRSRGGPRSPPSMKTSSGHASRSAVPSSRRPIENHHRHGRARPISPAPIPPPPERRGGKHRAEDKISHAAEKISRGIPASVSMSSRHILATEEGGRVSARSRAIPGPGVPEDPRLKVRVPEPPVESAQTGSGSKKHKDKSSDKLKTRVKIEGEKRKKTTTAAESSDSDDSSDSSNSLPTFTATTRLTLSERFGKMAQWSVDRSNMENMRITKDSTGGALKVMIEEGLESPSRRFTYSPAPPGHFPEELATTAPSGTMSWDDVRVRYDYYKNCGYLRDLDLKDYVKWEEWWYRYQEWLKQERYHEFWERQQMRRRHRKKIPIAQRLN